VRVKPRVETPAPEPSAHPRHPLLDLSATLPPQHKLPELARGIYAGEAEQAVQEEIEQLLDIPAICREVAEELREVVPLEEASRWIREGFAEDATLSWDAVVRQCVGKQIGDKKERLRAAVMAKLKEVAKVL
jgi:hypothetical protein